MTKPDTTTLSLTRVPKPLKAAIKAYAKMKGRSASAQSIIFLWDRLEDMGIGIKGGGGNRTHSLSITGAR